ncbi:MAG: hypothetical protein HZC24_14600 [Rhodocyclales bacterium]|nr:hypothetical protein [Rhodocyclales bacterium]
MGIRQVNASYVGSEDRILLRVTMDEGDELRFWLTRAVLRSFALQAAAWLTAADATQAAAVRAFKREAAAAQADFATPLKAGESFPLGAAPILATSLRLESAEGESRLVLSLIDKRAVTLHLDEEALAGIQRLIHQTAAAAEWGLPAILPTVSAVGKAH